MALRKIFIGITIAGLKKSAYLCGVKQKEDET